MSNENDSDKVMSVSDLLNSEKSSEENRDNKDVNKEEQPTQENTEKENIKYKENEQEETIDAEKDEQLDQLSKKTGKKRRKKNVDVSKDISDNEMNKIEKSIREKAHFFSSAVNAHDHVAKIKEQEEKEIEEFKKNRDSKANMSENKDDTIDLNVQREVKNKDRGKNLSKLEKIKKIGKRKGKSAEILLPASNYMIKMHGMNTWINYENYFSTFFKEFGFFQNINKLKMIYENSEFLFRDGDRVDFTTFLQITSPTDLTLIYALWSVVNNDDEPVDVEVMCQECGASQEIKLKPKEVLENSFSPEQRKRIKNYDPTKTINELQKNVVMGEERKLSYTMDSLKFKIIMNAPHLKRYFDVDDKMRSYIVEQLEEHLPNEIKGTTDDTDKLRWLYRYKQGDVNALYGRYTDLILYMESVEVMDFDDDDFGNIKVSLEDDGIHTCIEFINQMPDELLDQINNGVGELTEEDDTVQLRGEPFKCKECNKISENDNIPAGDILFFTIQKMIQKKSSERRQSS